MTYLTESRDALAKALYVFAHREGRDERARAWEFDTIPEGMKDQRREAADALIASGAVIPAATLADAMEQRLRNVREFGERGSAYYNGASHMLRAFAALTERSQ